MPTPPSPPLDASSRQAPRITAEYAHYDAGATASQGVRTLIPILVWAVYLACSWTWVIGMFLPVLLIRDYGDLGFVIFAIPNIVGAAAMGWVLASPQHSARIVADHRAACALFSLITLAFHVFFVAWYLMGRHPHIGPASGPALLAPYLPLAIIALAAAAGLARPWKPWLSIWVYAASLACTFLFAWFEQTHTPDPSITDLVTRGTSPNPIAALWLAPVVVFGFLLCPYLDLTFHRARQNLPTRQSSAAAFTLGFALFFATMILFTRSYAGFFIFPYERAFVSWAAIAITAHLLQQAAYTCALHAGELGLIARAPRLRTAVATILAAALILGLLAHTRGENTELSWLAGFGTITTGEQIYRAFMGFYGLIFPAYVWLIMIPTRDGHAGPTRAKLRILALAVGIALPMFYMGFIERRELFLVPGLLTILLARLALPKSPPRPPS